MQRVASPHARCRHKAYSLTCQQYDELLAREAGACWTCGRSGKRLVIDHDHRHGMWAVRGVICQGCNSQLRPDRQDPAWAAEYLADPWFKRELERLSLSSDAPREPALGRARSFDGKAWFREAGGLWTHGFKNARRITWARLFYDFGPWGLVIAPAGEVGR